MFTQQHPQTFKDSIDLEAYFQRIGYRGERTPTLQTLETIHYSHTQAIAFENLNPLFGQPVLLDLNSLQKKLVEEGRGGYCFEQNSLFRAVLIDLGFQVSSLGARVLWGVPEGVITPRSHMLLIVHIENEPYIADVGFGGLTLTTPIRLTPEMQQSTSHELFRLIKIKDSYIMQAHFAEKWQSLYQFDLQPQYPPDYEVSNWYVSTHPESLFVNSLIAARPDTDCRYALRNNRFSIHSLNNENTEHHMLTTAQELCSVLTHEFRLQLPTNIDLESMLHRFVN
ncbi:arylamine N-acetyltransferase family protein [Acaryochloris marina]|uniref:arylamine N-acetyltransferase family protein n=1 Tax=Acaryochloris marina TaxID=155978 RepID=UPI0021C347E3|nr:arylamine N-acetyltransferase [Acaryochloris marina]BDM83674.1 N-hydroxyarylamine O-acetyltransferase [Acaryochloris marina MBIC10699]